VKIILPQPFIAQKIFLLLLFSLLFTKAGFSQANNLCGSATSISSSTSCIATPGSLLATTSYTTIASACGNSSGNRNDVWYQFTAQTIQPFIQLTSTIPQLRFQVYTAASCGGTITSVLCTTGLTGTPTLTVGQSYLIRVYSNSNQTGTFNICVQDNPPANDACSNATVLTQNSTCVNTTGQTLLNALPTAIVPGNCGAASSPEVWYRFVANTNFPIISLSNVGSSFSGAGARIQLLSGSCGLFTSLSCVSGNTLNTLNTIGGAGLIIGNTYYVRVYTNTAAVSGTNWGFDICVSSQTTAAPGIEISKTYINISKGVNGGTIEPGDILEIRGVVAVSSNTAYNCSFFDVIPNNTTYVPGTLRILTNEGKIFRQWTDAVDSDPAQIVANAVTINIGNGANATQPGTVTNTDRPSLFGTTCVLMATYRVTVNAVPFNSLISMGTGNISYRTQPAPGGTGNTITFPAVTAIVYKSFGICANTVGGNAILSEFGGTFGSGNTKDRAASTKIPTNYAYVPFAPNNPGDYRYGMSNNTSTGTAPANYSIDPNETVGSKKVFSVWDVIGDHTGATNPLLGNLPADVNNGQSGGYMAVINAAYRTDTAFLDTITNLCPNTSYEYSAWFRNICRKCGADSTGVGSTTPGYVPTGPGDTSGVHPVLAFNVNGYDYYSSGDVLYTGQWVKKGFTYRTGPTETQMIINIRNSAPGGGGNDWAIDDIAVATCTPNLNLFPGPNANTCYGNQVDIYSEIKSFFDNYIYASWEKSTNGGATWTSTGFIDTLNYIFNGTEYVDTSYFPSFLGDSAQHLNKYRVRVASTAANLNDPNCSFTATTTVVIYVHNCEWILKTSLLNADGVVKNNYAAINWLTSNETTDTKYVVEKSTDKNNYKAIGVVQAMYGNGNGGKYIFNDPEVLNTPAYYRIKITEAQAKKYSKIILLNPNGVKFEIKAVENPFNEALKFDVTAPVDGSLLVNIIDGYGRVVKNHVTHINKGITNIALNNTAALNTGTYTLKVMFNGNIINKRIIKINQ
jgi:trimeric autotransporter adhesin